MAYFWTMKRAASITIALLSFFLLPSCERDARIDLEALPPELVVLANFSNLDTLEVVVSKTRPTLSEEHAEYVSDGAIEVFIDGFFADRLGFDPSPSPGVIPGYYISSKVVPQPGQHFRMVLDVPGFKQVQAQSTMPYPVEIDTAFTNLLIEKGDVDEFYNQATITIGVKILDPPSSGHFYHLNFYQQGYDLHFEPDGDTLKTSFFSLPLVVVSDDDAIPLIPYIESRGALFSEEALSSNQGELSFTGSFQYRKNDQELGDFLIELRSVSPEYYYFHRSLARQYQASHDPFSEPVILYTNVENGQGVFAGFVPRFYQVETAH